MGAHHFNDFVVQQPSNINDIKSQIISSTPKGKRNVSYSLFNTFFILSVACLLCQ